LAVCLAVLSLVRVEPGFPPKFEYRDAEQWAARSTILVTEADSPLFRSVFEETVLAPGATTRKVTPDFAPSSRFVELATIYAHLATSDDVKRIMLREGGRFKGAIEAIPLTTANTGNGLPLISLGGISTSPEAAVLLAHRVTEAFNQYVADAQRRSGIPADQRVVLEQLQGPAQVELLHGRSKTLPIVVFITVMLAAIGLAFVLENLRPRMRPLAAEPPARMGADRARRSA
jgi:hypothetical protein